MNIGRNDPCPCGSGKKYKKCCLSSGHRDRSESLMQHQIRYAEAQLIQQLQAWLLQEGLWYLIEDAVEDFVSLMSSEPDETQLKSLWENTLWHHLFFDWQPSLEWDDFEYASLSEKFADQFIIPGFEKNLLNKLLNEPLTFLQVEDVIEGKGLYVHDLLLGRKFFVYEKRASISSVKGNIIFAKVITFNGTSVMMETYPYFLPGRFATDIMEFRDAISSFNRLGAYKLRVLTFSVIEAFWIIFDEAYRPPVIQNQDSDFIEPNELIYQTKLPLKPLLEKLLPLTPYSDMDEFLQVAATIDEKGNVMEVRFPRIDAEDIVIAEFFLTTNEIRIFTNSAKRAGRVKSSLTRRFGKQLQLIDQIWLDSTQPKDTATQEEFDFNSAGDNLNEPDALSPEIQEVLTQKTQAHWADWLTHPLPALNGKTPKQAVKSHKGREQLEALLLDFEGQNLSAPENLMNPDTDWLRQQLGME